MMKPTRPRPSSKMVLPRVGIISLDARGEDVAKAVLNNAPQNTVRRIDYIKSEDDFKNSLYGTTLLFVVAEYLEKRIFDIFHIAESIGIFCVLSLPEYAKDGAYYKKIAVLLSKENDSTEDEAKNIVSVCKFYSVDYNKNEGSILFDVDDMRDMMPKAYTSLLYRGDLGGMPEFIKGVDISHARGAFAMNVYNGDMDLKAMQQAMSFVWETVDENADVYYGVYHDAGMPINPHIVELFVVNATS